MEKHLDLLIISEDTRLLTDKGYAASRYSVYREIYGRVSVIVITEKKTKSLDEIAPTLWVYAVKRAITPFGTLRRIRRLIKKQLFFQFKVAADLITAENPFYAGLLALLLAKKIKLRFEVQVPINPYSELFDIRYEKPTRDRMIAKYVLKRAHGVRAENEEIAAVLSEHIKVKPENMLVARYPLDLAYIRSSYPQFSLNQKFPQLNFFLVTRYLGLDKKAFYQALEVLKNILKVHLRAGMIVLAEEKVSKKIKSHIDKEHLIPHVRFMSPEEHLSVLKTAHIYLDTTGELEKGDRGREELLLTAAVLGLPIVSFRHQSAELVVREGETGYLCAPGDIICLSQKIADILNDNRLRYTITHAPRYYLDGQFPVTPQEYVVAVYDFHHDIVTR